MNGRVAREIRQALSYHPRSKEKPREYHTFLVEGWTHVLQYDTVTGETKNVRRRGERENVECVSGDRKVYQYMKKKYVNPQYHTDLTKFPEKKEMDSLKDEIKGAMMASEEQEVKSPE